MSKKSTKLTPLPTDKGSKKQGKLTTKVSNWFTESFLLYVCAIAVVVFATDSVVARSKQIEKVPEFVQGMIALVVVGLMLTFVVKLVRRSK